jgi:hypothetical protein
MTLRFNFVRQSNLKEKPPMFRYAVTAALLLGFSAPLLAAEGFYIVRGPDRKCKVVATAPSATETTVTRVGKNMYVSREEADADMAVVCK